MTLLQATVLGIVQGITEFLPVSSSAHLILVPRFLGWPDQGLAFDVMTHGGTLLAVLVFFRRDLGELLRGLFRRPQPKSTDFENRAGAVPSSLAGALVLGTIPVGIAGLLLHDWLATAARDPKILAVSLSFFGVLLWAADRFAPSARGLASLRVRDGLWVGIAQTLALWPGTSRSGITITAGRALGFDRPAAARFSFLLSIPATGLAFAMDLFELVRTPLLPAHPTAMAAGFVAAAVSGYLVIAALLRWVSARGFLGFAIYRVLLAAVLWIALV